MSCLLALTFIIFGLVTAIKRTLSLALSLNVCRKSFNNILYVFIDLHLNVLYLPGVYVLLTGVANVIQNQRLELSHMKQITT